MLECLKSHNCVSCSTSKYESVYLSVGNHNYGFIYKYFFFNKQNIHCIIKLVTTH